MKITKFVVSFLLLTICSLFFIGCDLGYTDVTGLKITTSPHISLFTDETVKNMTVRVDAEGKWKISDIKVVVGDDSIIKIDYVKDSFDKYAIKFNVKGLKKGTTAFFFETADRAVRSNIIVVTVGPAYTSIEFKNSEDITLRGFADEAEISFLVLRGNRAIECPVDVEIISENPDVAEIVYTGHTGDMDTCAIIPRSYGETYVYLKSPDGEVMSERIRVVVIHGEDEEPIYFVLNTGTKKIHQHDCYTLKQIDSENKQGVWGSIDSYLDAGYKKCANCFDVPKEEVEEK